MWPYTLDSGFLSSRFVLANLKRIPWNGFAKKPFHFFLSHTQYLRTAMLLRIYFLFHFSQPLLRHTFRLSWKCLPPIFLGYTVLALLESWWMQLPQTFAQGRNEDEKGKQLLSRCSFMREPAWLRAVREATNLGTLNSWEKSKCEKFKRRYIPYLKYGSN